MTLIEAFTQFYAAHATLGSKINPSDKVLYYEVLGLWNSRRRPESIATTHAELIERTKLPERTYHRAMQRLTSMGWLHLETQSLAHGRKILRVSIDERQIRGKRENNDRVEEEPQSGSSSITLTERGARDDNSDNDRTAVSTADNAEKSRNGGSPSAAFANGREDVPRRNETPTRGHSAAVELDSTVPELQGCVWDMLTQRQILDD